LFFDVFEEVRWVLFLDAKLVGIMNDVRITKKYHISQSGRSNRCTQHGYLQLSNNYFYSYVDDCSNLVTIFFFFQNLVTTPDDPETVKVYSLAMIHCKVLKQLEILEVKSLILQQKYAL